MINFQISVAFVVRKRQEEPKSRYELISSSGGCSSVARVDLFLKGKPFKYKAKSFVKIFLILYDSGREKVER